MSFYRDQLEKYLSKLKIQGNLVLDIGGKQKPIKGRTAIWDVKEYQILDIPEFDLNQPTNLTFQADWIFCLEVFEYLINPYEAMKTISKFLKGYAIISFPLVYPIHNEVEWDSLRYTKRGIERLGEEHNLKIIDIFERKAKTNTLVKYYQEDGMKMAKGIEHNITGYIVKYEKSGTINT